MPAAPLALQGAVPPVPQKSTIPWDEELWGGRTGDPPTGNLPSEPPIDWTNAGRGQGVEDIQYYIPMQYGLPFIDSLMPRLGFERWRDPKTGRWYWKPGKYEEYDKGAVEQQMTGVRDAIEPDMLRELAAAEGALSERGMGRSSLSGGVQLGLRGGFTTELMKTRLQLIKEEIARRRQERKDASDMITDMAAVLANRKPEEPNTFEQFLGAAGGALSWTV